MKALAQLLRQNVAKMKPYSSARDEYKGKTASVFLDANENPYNAPYNRYPDPMQWKLKTAISQMKKVPAECLFLGNGSDEAIDLAYRAFCEPSVDNVVAIDPTYGMYQVCAELNNVEYRSVALDEHFDFSAKQLLEVVDKQTKLIFLCSPNNPSGNLLNEEEIRKLLIAFEGLVIVDEAYIDFARTPSWIYSLSDYPNLIVFQTFSKAWGCAAIRLGMAFASPEIIGIFNKIKYPYNINELTQREALSMLQHEAQVQSWVETLLEERTRLEKALRNDVPCCLHVFPSDANFVLARMTDASRIYTALVEDGIIVRNRSHITLCNNCLRITVGTPEENDILLSALKTME